MSKTPTPDDLVKRILALEKQVAELSKRAGLGSSAITRGALTVRHPNGVDLFRAGGFYLSGDPVQGVLIRRADGSVAFWAFSYASGANGYIALVDQDNNIIVSDDLASGVGLARPWLPVPFRDAWTTPPPNTTSGTFTPMQEATYTQQHPRLLAHLLVRASDGSTAGEVRVTVDGVQVGEVRPVAAGEHAYAWVGPFALPGDFSEFVNVAVEARRTAGSGTVGVRVVGAWGIQS